MQDTIQRKLYRIADHSDKEILRQLFTAIGDRLSSCATSSAGLVIKIGGSTLAKTGASVFQAVVQGKSIAIAAATDMPALTGLTITANKFNVACFFVDSSGTTSVAFGTEGATESAVVFPDFPVGKALIGYLVITHSATFTGGTTALDTATTKYVSPVGAFDPTLLVS